VSSQLQVPVALTTAKESQYLTDRRLAGPQNQYGGEGEEIESLLLPGINPRSSSP